MAPRTWRAPPSFHMQLCAMASSPPSENPPPLNSPPVPQPPNPPGGAVGAARSNLAPVAIHHNRLRLDAVERERAVPLAGAAQGARGLVLQLELRLQFRLPRRSWTGPLQPWPDLAVCQLRAVAHQ